MQTLEEARVIVSEIRTRANTIPVRSSAGFDRVVQAMVIAEDRRFRQHKGIDWWGVARALWLYVARRRVSGASTIEQQLVRTLRKRYEVTLGRKLSEMLIAAVVSRAVSKADIAKVYLRVAYFGWRATGVDQAAQRLGISIDSITWQEAATVASLLKYPMPRYPSAAYTSRLSRRVTYVLEKGGFK